MSILNYLDHSEKKNKKEYFIHLIEVTLADGEVTSKESAMLHKLGRKMGFTDPEIDSLFSRTVRSSYVPDYDLTKRFDQLYDIIKMVLADEKIEESEMHLARIFAHTAGFQNGEIPQLLDLLIKGIQNGKDEEQLLKDYKSLRKQSK